MDHFQIDDCLASMEILVDTREQPSNRALKRYESFGCPYLRQKLNYGDYAYNFTLPNGMKYHQKDISVSPDVVIERKEDLTELSGNLCQHRQRFINEMERAIYANAKIYLLVEDANWENLINGKYRTKFNPKAYEASLEAFMVRYGVTPIFCKFETSGHLIKNILYRELKERLERGEYDWLIQDGLSSTDKH